LFLKGFWESPGIICLDKIKGFFYIISREKTMEVIIMKKSYIFIMLFAVSLLIWGCAGDTGPAGPDGADGDTVFVMNFQQGAYPDSGYAGVTDARLFSDLPDSSGDDDSISIGQFSDTRTYRSVIKFDIDGLIPANAGVTNAYLTLKIDNAAGVTDVTSYLLTRGFVEGEVTWNSYSTGNGWTTPGGDYSTSASSQISITSAGVYSFKLTNSIVQGWIDNPADNYGLLLKAANEITYMNRIHGDSSNVVTETDRPKLTIYYKVD